MWQGQYTMTLFFYIIWRTDGESCFLKFFKLLSQQPEEALNVSY